MLEAGNAFYKEARLPGTFNNQIFLESTRNIIKTGGVIFASFAGDGSFMGALAAQACNCIFTGVKTMVEVFWFVLPRYRGGPAGIRLLHTFDRWCKINGVTIGAMIHLAQETSGLAKWQLEKLYGKLGFRLVEYHFIKDYRQVLDKEGVTT